MKTKQEVRKIIEEKYSNNPLIKIGGFDYYVQNRGKLQSRDYGKLKNLIGVDGIINLIEEKIKKHTSSWGYWGEYLIQPLLLDYSNEEKVINTVLQYILETSKYRNFGSTATTIALPIFNYYTNNPKVLDTILQAILNNSKVKDAFQYKGYGKLACHIFEFMPDNKKILNTSLAALLNANHSLKVFDFDDWISLATSIIYSYNDNLEVLNVIFDFLKENTAFSKLSVAVNFIKSQADEKQKELIKKIYRI